MTHITNNLPAPVDVTAQIALARELAASNLLPDQYRKQPANLLWAIQYAQALGVHPMTAVTGIAVINGRPTASAQLIGGLVRRAGHKLRVQSSDTKAVAEVVRADDPDFTFRVEWTMERAKRAGLGGRGPWQQYPAAMLTARAITEVARMAAPEALFGIIYTPEELGADVDDEGVAVGHVEAIRVDVEQPSNHLDDLYEVEDNEEGGAPTVTTWPGGEETQPQPGKAARNQLTRIAILRKELELDEQKYRDQMQKLYGVQSAKDLTQEQAGELIDKLTAAKKRKGGDK